MPNNDTVETCRTFDASPEYWQSLGIARTWQDCKCRGNGWCELHDNFDPEDDSYA